MSQNPISFTNQGDPNTTALLIAYDLLKESRSKEIDPLAPIDFAKQINELVKALLAGHRFSPVGRREPMDPYPGCAEGPGTTCDWPGGPREPR